VSENLGRYQEHVRQIEAELATLQDHEWAGRYVQTNESDCGNACETQDLLIAPRAGFAWEFTRATSPWRLNYGQVTSVDQDRIRLHLEIDPIWNVDDSWVWSQTQFSGELVRVRMNSRRYLIPEERMADFCNALNGEPTTFPWTFLVHADDWRSRVEWRDSGADSPELPKEWRSRLLPSPVECEIVAVGSRVRVREPPGALYEWRVCVDAGSREGFFRGMVLHSLAGRRGRVVDLTDHEAQVAFRYGLWDQEADESELSDFDGSLVLEGTRLRTSQHGQLFVIY